MIDANPLSGVFTSVVRACDGAINHLPRFLLATTMTALTLSAAAQTNDLREAATQTPSFQGLGQMPGAMRGAGTFAVNISSDGSTIVGYAWVCPNGGTTCNSSGKTEAYRWTRAIRHSSLFRCRRCNGGKRSERSGGCPRCQRRSARRDRGDAACRNDFFGRAWGNVGRGCERCPTWDDSDYHCGRGKGCGWNREVCAGTY